jgi:uncharacterized protein (TIGR02996 family)
VIDNGLQALLAAVYDAEDSDDRTPRLVLADYLEETGDQVASELLRREAHYQTMFTGGALRQELGRRLGLPPKKTYWRHGLPWSVDLSVANLDKVSAQMRQAAAQGWIGTLEITGFNRQKKSAVTRAGWLQEVPRLAMSLHARADAPAAIDALPPWENLTGLHAADNPTLSDAAVIQLTGRKRLASLDVPRCVRLTDAVINPLSGLSGLRWARLSAPAIQRVEPPPGSFLRLGHLDLSGCAGLSVLRLRALPRLTEVNLSGCSRLEEIQLKDLPEYIRLDALGLGQLRQVEVSGLPRMIWLILRHCHELRVLRVEGTPRLAQLNVSECPHLPAATVAALRRAMPQCTVHR